VKRTSQADFLCDFVVRNFENEQHLKKKKEEVTLQFHPSEIWPDFVLYGKFFQIFAMGDTPL